MATDETFVTPVSSAGDLMAMSPERKEYEQSDFTSDFLTGTDFDSTCDITMHEVQNYDDLFINPNNLDYLDKCTESKKNHNLIDRGKDSLFVKFDPLYAKPLLTNSMEDKTQVDPEYDIGYETGSSNSVINDNVLANSKSVVEPVLSKCSSDKPTQVVNPVVSFETTKVTKSQTSPTPVLVRSISAILTPTQVGLGRLVNIPGNTPPQAAPRSPRHYFYGGAPEIDRLQSLRNILQKQEQDNLQLLQENMELKSLKRINEDLEGKIKALSEEKEAWLRKEFNLIEQVNNKVLSNKQMAIVMLEYEKTITSLIDEQQKEKSQYEQQIKELTAERDDSLKHLTIMESSFNDLLAKYEKCKSVIYDFRDREKTLQEKILEYEDGMKKYDVVYNKLKETAAESLNKANETLDNINKTHSIEIAKLNAMIKKDELMISSLQESLAQKTRDNEELAKICDQLIKEYR